MNKNLVLIVIAIVVVSVLGTVGTLVGTGALDPNIGIPLIASVVTLVLGALLALLDPKPGASTPSVAEPSAPVVPPVVPGP